MKKTIFLFILLMVAVAFSCSKREAAPLDEHTTDDSTSILLPGDSTLYGLACEGCTDSVIVFLSGNGSDPVTYDIVDARKQHKVFGHPKVGDRIALLVNKEDSLKADWMVCIDNLKGAWCYMVIPELSIPSEILAQHPLPDSIKKKLLQPAEYGIELLRGWAAQSIGNISKQGKDSIAEFVKYPVLTRYTRWNLWNGKLLFTKSKVIIDKDNNVTFADNGIDTTELVLLRSDSLVLRWNDHTQGYYRKKD